MRLATTAGIFFLALLSIGMIFFSTTCVHAQTPHWGWSKIASGTYDQSYSVATDRTGNIFITGNFRSPFVVFDQDTLVSQGNFSSIYLTKYNPYGNVVWSRCTKEDNGDVAYHVTTDDHGNAYITGYFESYVLIFGTDTLFNPTGSADVFVAKYSPDGDVLWARSAYGGATDIAESVVTDHSGNVLVAGRFFSDSLIFGSITLMRVVSDENLFIAKYDSIGNIIWARTLDAVTGHDNAIAITTNDEGDVFITGQVGSPFAPPDSAQRICIYSDLYLAKYKANGDYAWIKTIQGDLDDFSTGLAIDHQGNIYMSGYFYSDVLKVDTSQGILLGNGGAGSIFLIKYNKNGHAIWAKSALGNHGEEANGVAVDDHGNIYETGFFESDTLIFGQDTLYDSDSYNFDIFVVKYDSTGSAIWATSAAGPGSDFSYGVATADSGRIYITGAFDPPSIQFGNIIQYSNQSTPQIFVASISDAPKFATLPAIVHDNGLKVYPVPASEFITIELPKNETLGSLKIFNELGQCVIEKNEIHNYQLISVSVLPKGTYTVQVTDGKVIHTGSILVQ